MTNNNYTGYRLADTSKEHNVLYSEQVEYSTTKSLSRNLPYKHKCVYEVDNENSIYITELLLLLLLLLFISH